MKKIAVVCVVLVFILTSCQKNKEVEKYIKYEDSFKVALSRKILTLDPMKHNDLISGYVSTAIYDTLFRIDEEGYIDYLIAKSHDYATDRKLNIEIHKGIKFHDGSSLTAEDVKASLERSRKEKSVSKLFEAIEHISVIDDYNITIITKMPYAPLIGNLTHSGSSIMPKKIIENREFDKNIGSGPYTFKSMYYDRIILEKNNKYFLKDERSDWKYLEFNVVTDSDKRQGYILDGKYDMNSNVKPYQISKLKDLDELELLKVKTSNINYLVINNTRKFLNDVNFRKALNYGINKEEINKISIKDIGETLKSVTPSNILGYNEDVNYNYDVKKAKEYLEKTEYEGEELTFLVSGEEKYSTAQVIKSNLKDIGINVKIESEEIEQYRRNLNIGQYDIGLLSWTTGKDPDRYFTPLFHSDSVGIQNKARYSNPEVDYLIEAGITTIDKEERELIYGELHRKVMDSAPIVPLYSKDTIISGKKYDYIEAFIEDGNIYFNLIRKIEKK